MRLLLRNVLIVGLLLAATQVFGKGRFVNIVFIGNSITYGAGLENPTREAPPVKAAIYLSKNHDIASVKYSNRGRSGCTTVDYLPETNTLFKWATEAADNFKDETWADLVFSIMLGTNDSAMEGTNGCPVAPRCYYKNMRCIVDKLLELYPNCKIVIHRPLWYSPNTYNGAKYLRQGLSRLSNYYPKIEKLIEYYSKSAPGHVFLGDVEGFNFFKDNHLEYFQAEPGNAGTFYLHPNREGAVKLGELWGEAILRILKD